VPVADERTGQKFSDKPKVKTSQKGALVRRKRIGEEPPQISALIPRYSIIADIRDKPANITISQLLQEVPSMQVELSKSLRKSKVLKKKARTFVNLQPTPKSTNLYCDAVVHEKVIPLIVDSGSSGSVVASHLLSELGIKVERPSTVNMVNVYGQSKKAIGEISEFPFSVGGVVVPIDVVVTDALSYQAIVGNDWLSKFRKLHHTPIQDDRLPKITKAQPVEDSSEESESGEKTETEYEEEELDDRLFGFFEDEHTVFQYQRSNGRGAGEAWWNMDGDEDYLPEDNFSDFDDNDEDSDPKFFFEEVEESSRELDIGDLWDDDHDKLEELLVGYDDLFAWTPQELGRTDFVTHSIHTEGALPIKQRYY
ncbi:7447_t:CDS:2, partial [Ambispora leptoticha]